MLFNGFCCCYFFLLIKINLIKSLISFLFFFLQTKPMLVSSLLRLPDNSCIISEAEKDLFSNSKFSDLFILYKQKKMHRKGFDLFIFF